MDQLRAKNMIEPPGRIGGGGGGAGSRHGSDRSINITRGKVPFVLMLAALLLSSIMVCQAFDLNLLPEEQEDELAMIEQPPPRLTQLSTSGSAQAAPPAPASPPLEPLSRKFGLWESVKGYARGAADSTIGQLPQYFNFKKFSAQYKRHYSQAEAMFRKSMFLQHCIQVFKSRVAFRSGRKSYTEEVNKFSDRSDNEFGQMFMSGPPIESRPQGQSEQEYYEQLERVQHERSRLLADDQAELPSKASRGGSDDDDYDDDDDGAATILNEAQARRQIELMLASQSFDEQMQVAILEEMRGATGDGFSQASLDADRKRALPWPGTRPLPVPEVAANPPLVQGRQPYSAPELDDTSYEGGIDWSEHQCFHKIYDQGIKCGKCYVMAATALAEFYKCSENLNEINRRQFSKDYVLDCGQKYSPTILGCTGGSLLDTLEFIAKAGVHNIKSWRSMRDTKLREMNLMGLPIQPLDTRCPLNRLDKPLDQWGAIKIGIRPQQVEATGWLEALEDGPLAVSVQMPSEGLQGYAGGVHDGSGCSTSGHWHSMVLVGYGQNERGLAYWRFRNSWGDEWGDRGHFNMAMSVPGECLAGGVRLYRDPAIRV